MIHQRRRIRFVLLHYAYAPCGPPARAGKQPKGWVTNSRHSPHPFIYRSLSQPHQMGTRGYTHILEGMAGDVWRHGHLVGWCWDTWARS